MSDSRGVYIFRRLAGLILYGLAYTALWPGLTLPVVTIQGNPTFWSNSKLGVGTGDQFLEPTSRSTVELVLDLLKARYYFPCGIIVLFSIISPAVKLLIILYGEIVGNIFRIKFDDTSKLVDLRKGLRMIAKYQAVDVFVTIITRQLLNSDFVTCKFEPGFYYFSFYSVVSILAAQVSDTVPQLSSVPHHAVRRSSSDSKRPSLPVTRMSKLEAFLLFCSVSMFIVGLAWSVGFPILSVKFLFQSKIVIGESTASLSSFLEGVSLESDLFDDRTISAIFVLVTCIIIPTLVVTLSTIIQCCDASRTSRFLFGLAHLTSYMADWSLIDVFAVALLTNLFAFASFSVLRTSAPWGFYCVLMAAMSAYEVVKAVRVSILDRSVGGYTQLDEEVDESADTGIEMGDAQEFGQRDSEEISPTRQRKKSLNQQQNQFDDDKPQPSPSTTVTVKSGFLYVIITIIKKLGLPFFMLKALGWAVFFIVWFMNSGSGSLDINSLSATLRSNLPFVRDALHESLPVGVGMCSHLQETFPAITVVPEKNCVSRPYLHYERNRAYEVLARWVAGFKEVDIVDMFISIPSQGRLSLNVRGRFSEIQLSLFIGQCLKNFFSDQSDIKEIPACSSVFDNIHKWSNVTWSIEVEADCKSTRPYVRDIVVDDVMLDTEMKIEEELGFGGFGITIPVDDLSDQFKKGIRDSIQPLLATKDKWIPWGPNSYDLTTLLSKLVELNVETHGGTLAFACPAPAR